jgi:hypothetical protein
MRTFVARFGHRPLAAIWFAAFGFLATVLFFLPLSGKSHVVVLYMLLPSTSAGLAGYICGGAILDSAKIRSYGKSLRRGLMVTAVAYAIFSVLYGLALPLIEQGWSLREGFGLMPFALIFGFLMMGRLAAIAGMVAGATLFRFGRVFCER